jgi:ATP-dependent DNA helicase RecG
MTREDLERIVDQGETERVEFKRSTGQRTEAMKTVCAMLNGMGGYVLFGVGNDGTLVGQAATARTLEEIASELRRIEPPTFPDIFTIPIDGGRSVIVLVVSGGGGPYTYDGRSFLRVGPTTSIMPRDRAGK